MKRTVLLTGASRGIGKAIFQRLQAKNYTMISPSRSELDLIDDKSIERFVKKNKGRKIDIIINNAGVNYPQWITEMEDRNIAETMQVNLVAPIKLIRGLSTHMIKNKWGRIVNISSAFGIVARGKQILYCSTKHGINGMTKALALEFAQHNIFVNAVCPGFTRTDLVVQRNTPEKIAVLEKDIPLGRLADPKEVVYAVEFLIHAKNTYITGETLVIDGGFTIR